MLKQSQAGKLFNKKDLNESEDQSDPNADLNQWMIEPPITRKDSPQTRMEKGGKVNEDKTLAAFEISSTGTGWRLSFLGHYRTFYTGDLMVLRPKYDPKDHQKTKPALAALQKSAVKPSTNACVLFLDRTHAKAIGQNAVLLDNIWQLHDLCIKKNKKTITTIKA